ncbi:MAG TPA: peptidase domain-containing ABC transporter [Acetobacteraceae bacterium]|nr:peptidase domain-containing ABC transporter [Acetobacteraceae bacterium]
MSATEAPTAARSAGNRPNDALEARLLAIEAAARFHNVELDREELRFPRGGVPEPAALVAWARDGGLWAKAVRMRFAQLLKIEVASPVILLLRDGSAAILTTVDPARNIVWLKDPRAPSSDPPIAVDELRLSQVWGGETLLIRAIREITDENAPFSFMWVWGIVRKEHKLLRDMFFGSFTLSLLTLVPPIIVMTTLDRVLTYRSVSTLALISIFFGVALLYETILGYTRRKITYVVGARVDARISLHIFKRMLRLPLDYFERQQAGEISYKIGQVNKIRDFLTGKMLSTMLDLVSLVVLVPVVFLLQPTLAWITLVCAGLIAVVIMIYLGPVNRAIGRWIAAETQKSSVLVETLHGIRTVKSLALEPQQRDLWDRRTATSVQLKLEASDIANWPQTLVNPLEGIISRGTVLIGAMLAISSPGSIDAGSLMGFMMIAGRVASPLIGLARLMDDFQEVRLAVGFVQSVINQPPESVNPSAGLRPKVEGALEFNKVNYTYPGTKTRALDGVSFSVPVGTMLGLVGKSGSGKSTIARLLQGISRDYEGFLKLDGNDLREINLNHLRRNFGVVLQENFLFRGTIRENIIAGRPGLTLTDAVRAARLAGAEEFIERMPNGYETWIEEGSPNLSGGQRQRLAIARALIHDPRLLILDEATSALDPESEALVNANLTRIGQGRTMVIVSHRLASLTDCDQILVLDKGKVLDIAPHAVLLERCSVYRQLWFQQNRHLESPTPPRGGMPVLAQGD